MIWVSSSAALVLVCALSLFWVAPSLQRRREAAVEARAGTDGADPTQDLPTAPAEPPSAVSRRRRITMSTTDTTSRPADSGAGHRPSTGALRIKRDRAVIFLAGCTSLLTAAVTAVAAPFSAAVAWPWPVFLLLLGAGSVLALRYLAVQDRRARRHAPSAGARSADPHAPRADVALFDHEHGAAEEVQEQSLAAADDLDLPRQEEQPVSAAFTVEELRAEALRVARESPGADEDRTWAPVPVPRPTYTEAPVVQRPEPEPLAVPEQPAARSGSLKDAVRAGEDRNRAALDLDEVLRRRRA